MSNIKEIDGLVVNLDDVKAIGVKERVVIDGNACLFKIFTRECLRKSIANRFNVQFCFGWTSAKRKPYEEVSATCKIEYKTIEEAEERIREILKNQNSDEVKI